MLAKKVVGVAVFWSSFFMCRAGRARHVTSFSLLFLILFLPFHFFLLPCSYADYADGDGSPEFPFQIAEPNQLIYMSEHPEDWDKHFILTADINLALVDPNTFTTAVIAADTDNSNYSFDGTHFAGTFDGNDRTISNLTIDTAGADCDYLGLFGLINDPNAEVKNLGLENVSITGGDDSWYLGGLCGRSHYGSISNCYATSSVTGGDYSVFLGGLCGHNSYGAIGNCYATGSVTGGYYTYDSGGLCGVNGEGIISNCYSTGSVTVGVGSSWIGGLCGFNNGSISNCYASGAVSGEYSYPLGGFCGTNGGTISNCFWDMETSEMTTSAGGVGLTTSQMQNTASYYAWGQEDEAGIWTIDDGNDYPHLAWENQPGNPIVSMGAGTENDPYLISTAGQLVIVGSETSDFDKHFKLIADINMNVAEPNVFTTALIAPEIVNQEHGEFDGIPFTGTFDGNGFIVRNLTITVDATQEDVEYIGLFGQIYHPAQIFNLGVVNVNITVTDERYTSFLGGLVGYSYGGIINECYSTGSICSEGPSQNFGGLVGYNYGYINECYSAMSVSRIILEHYFSNFGGLCGSNTGLISNCYTTGLVKGADSYGGLCGENRGSISNCYSIASVPPDFVVGFWGGGLVGHNYNGITSNCFWDIDTSGVMFSAGGIGLHTEQMQKESTYYAWGVCGNEGVWTIDDGNDYPRLAWENRPGIVIVYPVLSEILEGTGAENDPYCIYTAQELVTVRHYTCEYDKHYKLMADINMNLAEPNVFLIALIAPGDGPHFTGVFDGNSHVIKNLTIDTAGANNNYLGLFGNIDSSARIMNLGLENINVNGGDLSNYLCGLAGRNYGTISNCYCTSSVTGNNYLGGLVGRNHGSINDCYSMGSITGYNYLGGLVGYNLDSVIRCFSTVSIVGNYSGGVVGCNSNGNVADCFWDVETSGVLISTDGVGLTTEQMQKMGTYYAWGLDGNQGVWTIDEGNDYPRLAWENQIGTPISNPQYLSEVLEGAGEPNDPYLIFTATQLGILKYYTEYDKHYKVMADINLNLAEPNVTTTAVIAPDIDIYSDGFQGILFNGTFDGNSHVIRNLVIDVAGTNNDYLGLFGQTGESAQIINLNLENITITGKNESDYIGGLVGNNSGDISECSSTGIVTGGSSSRFIGGLIGKNNDGYISACQSSSSVSGSEFVGGLIGRNSNGNISNCYATGSVTGGDDSDYLGGLCGKCAYGDNSISNCHATGLVTGGVGSNYLSGLCGYKFYGIISHCYATGSVTGGNYSEYLSGLCGRFYYGEINNCYATGLVTGGESSLYLGGLCGSNDQGSISHCHFLDSAGPNNGYGTPLDDPNMRIQSSFVNWDFVGNDTGPDDHWRMCEDGVHYPHLAWQYWGGGDFACPDGVEMADYAYFANRWLENNCSETNNCGGVDMNRSGTIDLLDLYLFCENWLNE